MFLLRDHDGNSFLIVAVEGPEPDGGGPGADL
jgi:hypothetical protein